MQIDSFMPSKLATLTLTVAAVVQHAKIPIGGSTAAANPPLVQGGEFLVVQVEGAAGNVTAFMETGPGASVAGVETCNIIATVANSFPLRAGQTYRILRQPGDTHMSIIGSGAGPTTVYVTPGTGTV